MTKIFLYKKSIKLFLSIFLLFLGQFSYADISAVDDIGNTVTLTQPAKRIIGLSPGVTELIFAAGGGDFLKGVVSYSDFPEAANKIPQIGSYNSLDIEKIVALNPDLVVAWKSGNPPLQISQLKKLGIAVYVSEPHEFNDIPLTLLRLGTLMGTSTIAKKESGVFQKRLSALKMRYPKTSIKKRVFIEIWDQPIMSINGNHLISKIIEQCNGENIFHNTPQLTLSLDAETVIQHNPDVIFATRQGQQGNSWLAYWKKWTFLSAVKNEKLYTLDPDAVVRHTPRIIDGIEQVCGFLHSK